MPPLSVFVSCKANLYKVSHPLNKAINHRAINHKSIKTRAAKNTSIAVSLMIVLGSSSYVYADSMSALIAQKSAQSEPAVPSARISTRSTIQRASPSYASNNNPINNGNKFNKTNDFNNVNQVDNVGNVSNTQPIPDTYTYQPSPSHPAAVNVTYRYPQVQRQAPSVLPAFLSGNYDNVDSQYLPLLSSAETQSNRAAREVISMARKMALNERTIIQGGCWDYLDEVFKRAGVTRDTVHKGEYSQGPYANSNEIEIGDWLYYINHGYNNVEHSGLFVGWVDESAKQALILSYAGESRREPARYRVYDLSSVYQIMRPVV